MKAMLCCLTVPLPPQMCIIRWSFQVQVGGHTCSSKRLLSPTQPKNDWSRIFISLHVAFKLSWFESLVLLFLGCHWKGNQPVTASLEMWWSTWTRTTWSNHAVAQGMTELERESGGHYRIISSAFVILDRCTNLFEKIFFCYCYWYLITRSIHIIKCIVHILFFIIYLYQNDSLFHVHI